MSTTLSLSLDAAVVSKANTSDMLSPTSQALEQAMRVPSPDVEEDSSEGDSSDGDELFGCDGLEEEDSYASSQGTSSSSSSMVSTPASPSSFAGDNRRHASSTFRLGSSSNNDAAAAAKLRMMALRSPSVALRHDAALRSFQIKATTSPPIACPLPPSPTSSRTASSTGDVLESLRLAEEQFRPLFAHDDELEPRIEIEQDCDEEDDDEEESWSQCRSPTQLDAPLSGRQAASQRMLSAISRSPNATTSKVAVGAPPRRPPPPKLHSLSQRRITTSHKPLPSLEQITSRATSGRIAGVGTPAPCALTPAPRSPGTASLQPRSISCPTALPPRKQYGSVEVYVTPPTPRPAQGAIHGVVLARPGLTPRSNSTPDVLAVPAFDMAPGKARMEAERERNAALQLWNAWQAQAESAISDTKEQQAWREHANVNPWLVQLQVLAGLGSPVPKKTDDTPVPERTQRSKKHTMAMGMGMGEQRTMPRAPRRGSVGSEAAAQSTWWRAPSSAPIASKSSNANVNGNGSQDQSTSPPPSAPACVAVPMQRVQAARSKVTPPAAPAGGASTSAQQATPDARAEARRGLLAKLGQRGVATSASPAAA